MTEPLPDFLGIGAQKSGTTTLHEILKKHPQVFLPECKEVHYFTLHSEKNTKWYSSHYKNAEKKQVKGDITPFYIFDPKSPRLIKNLLPNVKILVLLRDPIERTLSQIFHSKRHGFELLEPDEALKAEEQRLSTGSKFSLQKHSYVARSKYIEQLDRYEEHFSKENILIIKSEELFEGRSSTYRQIQEFLGLTIKVVSTRIPKTNIGGGEAENVSPMLKEWLRGELYETAQEVQRRYGIDWGWL